MWGRYGRFSRLDAIEVFLGSLPRITEREDWQTTCNAAPGVLQPIVRIKPDGAESTIQSVLWGLLPFGTKLPTAKRPIQTPRRKRSTSFPRFGSRLNRGDVWSPRIGSMIGRKYRLARLLSAFGGPPTSLSFSVRLWDTRQPAEKARSSPLRSSRPNRMNRRRKFITACPGGDHHSKGNPPRESGLSSCAADSRTHSLAMCLVAFDDVLWRLSGSQIGLLIRRSLVRAQVGEPDIKHLGPTGHPALPRILDAVKYSGVYSAFPAE